MHSRYAIALLEAAIFISPVNAQMRGSVGGARVSSGRGITSNVVSLGEGRRCTPHGISLVTPYFYSDYFPEPAVIQAPPSPQVVVVQAAPATAEAPAITKIEPLLIEWQGDRYSRVTNGAETSGYNVPPDYAEGSNSRSVVGVRGSSVQKVHELPPVVLVFHDGRKEEVGSYSIVSGSIYTNADYWATGSWTRKIQIASLDVPATLKLNQERGVKFVLPSAANEVVTRP